MDHFASSLHLDDRIETNEIFLKVISAVGGEAVDAPFLFSD